MCFFFDRGLLSMCYFQLFKAHDSFSSSFLDVRKDPKHLFRKRSKMGDQTNPLLTFRTRKVNKRIGLLRPKASFCNIFAGTPHLTIFGATKYDAVSDLMHNWGPQRPDFKSALRVVKMVLNTQCYQYLWLSMWFHAKKSKETLKNSKSLILQCKFGSRAQK